MVLLSEQFLCSCQRAKLPIRFDKTTTKVTVSPPDEGKYERFKTELIRRLFQSQESRIKRLLQHEEIGDRMPSQFLRHLRGLGGTSVADELLRTLWLGRSSLRLQDILDASPTTDLEALALLADRIGENTPAPSHAARVDPPPAASIQAQLDDVSRQIAALSTGPLRTRTASRQRTSPGRDSSGEDNVITNQDSGRTIRVRQRFKCSHQ